MLSEFYGLDFDASTGTWFTTNIITLLFRGFFGRALVTFAPPSPCDSDLEVDDSLTTCLTMSQLFVPVDLYSPIIAYLSDKRYLCSLCAVSKSFRREAQRHLYRDVRLTGCYTSLVSFSNAVISNPRLGELVFSLSLPSRTHSRGNPSLLSQLIPRVLQSLINLDALYIANTFSLLSQCFLTPSDFTNCPFRLKTFGLRSGSLPLLDMVPFLTSQRDITYFKYEHRTMEGIHVFSDDQDLLPHLTCLCLSAWSILPHFGLRAITRLCLKDVTMNLDLLPKMMATLAIFSATLTHLSLELSGPLSSTEHPHPCLVLLLSIIRHLLPNLKFLHLTGQVIFNLRDDSFENILDSLSQLPALETFVIQATPSIPKETGPLHPRLLSRESCFELATLCLMHAPSLKHVAFIGREIPQLDVCCLRTPDGTLHRGDLSSFNFTERSWLL